MLVSPDQVCPIIRPMHSADLQRVWHWRNHEQIRRFMFHQAPIAWQDHVAWFERAVQDCSKSLLIFEASGEPAGFAHLDVTGEGGLAQWGFYCSPQAPKGYGMLLCGEVLRYGFEHLRLHRICGQILAYNEASLRLHARLGFALEGILRDGYFDGQDYHAVHCFGLLSEEWSQ